MCDWISPGTVRTLSYFQFLSARLQHLRGTVKESLLLVL